MDIKAAQQDMRTAYYGGASGALVSGSVWLIAGILALFTTQNNTVIFFLIGGMFIFPVSIIVDKLLQRNGKHAADNPFGQLAFETTVLMILGILIAIVIYQIQPLWFFPAMLLIIGGRYLVFATIFGMKTYWLFGAVLAIAGYIVFSLNLPFHMGALLGGIIEIAFTFILMVNSNKIDQKLK